MALRSLDPTGGEARSDVGMGAREPESTDWDVGSEGVQRTSEEVTMALSPYGSKSQKPNPSYASVRWPTHSVVWGPSQFERTPVP